MSGGAIYALRAQRRIGAAAAGGGMSAGSIALSLGVHAAALALLAPAFWSGDSDTGIQSISVTLVPGEPAQVSQSSEVETALPAALSDAAGDVDIAEPAPPMPLPDPPLPDPPRPQPMVDQSPEPAETAPRPAPAGAPLGDEVFSAVVAQVPAPVAPAPPRPEEETALRSAGPERSPAPPERPVQAGPDTRVAEPAPPTPQKAAELPPQRAEHRPPKQPQPATRQAPTNERAPAADRAASGHEAASPSSLVANLPTTTAFGSGDNRSGSVTASRSAKRRYAADLLRHIESHKRYPDAARRQRLKGAVTLSIALDRTGRLLSASVAESSAKALLDDEALAVARRAVPYPPIPDGMGEHFSFTVTLRFRP